MSKKYLLYISENYSFEIVRPIQRAILARNGEVRWFVEGSKVNSELFDSEETVLKSIDHVINYSPDAVIVPGNVVPNFIPGLKVQVFHGLEYKKKGHFRIRGFFDLYCTQGEITTTKFQSLAEKHGYFSVIETGWSKLDTLHNTKPLNINTDLPVILFAPTFSPNLTCAEICLEEIKALIKTRKHHWLAKFHPKMDPKIKALYENINEENFDIIESSSSLPLLQRADILVSDTSSMIGEFLLLNKPVITINNSQPGDYLIDIQSPEELPNAIEKLLSNPNLLQENIKSYTQKLHPYSDGKSSERILKAIDDVLENNISYPLKKKPLNLFRSFKIRKKLNYWKF